SPVSPCRVRDLTIHSLNQCYGIQVAGLTSRRDCHLWQTRSLTDGDHLEPRFQDAGLDGTGGAISGSSSTDELFFFCEASMYLLRHKSKGLLAVALLSAASFLAPVAAAQDHAGKARRVKTPVATL